MEDFEQPGTDAGAAPEATPPGGAPDALGSVTPAAQPQSAWNAQEWGLKYKGQTIYPESRDQLLSLAQKGRVMEERIADWNKKEQEWQAQAARFQPYVDLDQLFQKNPAFAKQVQSLYQQYSQGQPPQGDVPNALPPELQPIVQKVQEMDQWRQEQAKQAAHQEISRELQELADAHKDYDWQSDDGYGTLAERVMRHALDNNFPTLKAAFRDLMWDDIQVRKQTEAKRQAAEEIQRQHRQGVVAPGAPSPRPAPAKFDVRNASYADLAKMALAEMK